MSSCKCNATPSVRCSECDLTVMLDCFWSDCRSGALWSIWKNMKWPALHVRPLPKFSPFPYKGNVLPGKCWWSVSVFSSAFTCASMTTEILKVLKKACSCVAVIFLCIQRSLLLTTSKCKLEHFQPTYLVTVFLVHQKWCNSKQAPNLYCNCLYLVFGH